MDGGVDLRAKRVQGRVNLKRTCEGRKGECIGEAGVAGKHDSVLDLPAEVAAVKRREPAAWRRLARVFGG